MGEPHQTIVDQPGVRCRLLAHRWSRGLGEQVVVRIEQEIQNSVEGVKDARRYDRHPAPAEETLKSHQMSPSCASELCNGSRAKLAPTRAAPPRLATKPRVAD